MKKSYLATIFLFILISAYFFFNQQNDQLSKTDIFSEVKAASTFAYNENPELKTNRRQIIAQDVGWQNKLIPEEAGGKTSKDQVVEVLLGQKLLLQEADKKGIPAKEGAANKHTVQIAAQDVDAQNELITEESGGNTTNDKATEALVDQRLLMQEAGKKGIAATDEELNKYIEQVRASSGLDQSALEQQLIDAGYTFEGYRKSVGDLLTVSKLIDQELDLRNVKATDAEVKGYLQENKGAFQDFYDEKDPELEDILKNRVKMQLTREKQEGLVKGYVGSLRQRAKIEGWGGG